MQSRNYWFALCKMQRYSKFLLRIIPEKQQKCEGKYFVTCTKGSSHNNFQASKITFTISSCNQLNKPTFVYLTSFMFYILNFLCFSFTLFCTVKQLPNVQVSNNFFKSIYFQKYFINI